MSNELGIRAVNTVRRARARTGSSANFTNLLSPGRIGGLQLPNRVVMAAMDMNLCHTGELDEGDIDHFVARARGGVGLVITGTSAVAYPQGATTRKQPGLSDDRYLPGLRALADGVHAVGGRVCVQLCHHGKTSAVDTADGRPLLVPNLSLPKPDMTALIDTTNEERQNLGNAREGKTESYKEATEEDLAEVVRVFASAAARVKAAGIDAVEIHAGHGYLLNTFLSAGYNKRSDQWGGSVQNRARLTCDIVRAIRVEVGPGFPVLVKFNGAEFFLENGTTVDEAVQISRLFESAGADAIEVTGYSNDPFSGFTFGPLPTAPAAYRDVTRAIRAAVTIPVIAVGRVLPELGEQMLAAQECDFVAMGRWLLTDPDLVDKIAAGRRASVRPCIDCLVCVERNFFNDTPQCTVNPALRTPNTPDLPPTEHPRTVVVIGGGPSGMETARLAARCGHRVTLLEKSERLGGTAWFSQLTTPANGPFIEWQEHELHDEGVDVRTGVNATLAQVQALRPDVVVVATGARRDLPALPGADLPHVQTGDSLRDLMTGAAPATAGRGIRALLARMLVPVARLVGITARPRLLRALSRVWLPVARDVVVIGGGLVGLELGEFLAERRRHVTVLEDGPVLGLPMAMPRRLSAVARAKHAGVEMIRGAAPTRITATEVYYRVGDDERRAAAGTVIIAGGVRPDTSMADDLRAAGLDVRIVGDAGEVDYIFGAVHSAWRVAREL
ncbi:MAG: FAD-dependent oxidoreductase [Jatrophihabitans sp.]